MSVADKVYKAFKRVIITFLLAFIVVGLFEVLSLNTWIMLTVVFVVMFVFEYCIISKQDKKGDDK